MSNAAVATNGNNQPPAISPDTLSRVLIGGDLSRLDDKQKTDYYLAVCKSTGLNPLTNPFAYITLNGKLVLYALRAATDQLRSIHGISVTEVNETERDGVCVVTCKVSNAQGRTDISKGAVNLARLQGEALANAIMKAETKAKRRATLSICGLGMLDETEIEDIPASAKRPNPHVVTAEDVVGPPSDDPADQLPASDDPIKPLSKQMTRPRFNAMQAELQKITTEEELKAWGEANKNKIGLFPQDWQEIMQGLYKFQREDIRGRKPTPEGPGTIVPVRADEPPTDPQEFLQWVDGILAAVTDPSLLDAVYNYQVEPHIERLLPPDQAECVKLFERHEARLKDDGTTEPSEPLPKEPAPRQFNTLALREQAVLLCKRPVFWKFLNEQLNYAVANETDAAEAVRELCNIASRSNLGKTTQDSTAFKKLRDKFLAWEQVG